MQWRSRRMGKISAHPFQVFCTNAPSQPLRLTSVQTNSSFYIKSPLPNTRRGDTHLGDTRLFVVRPKASLARCPLPVHSANSGRTKFSVSIPKNHHPAVEELPAEMVQRKMAFLMSLKKTRTTTVLYHIWYM